MALTLITGAPNSINLSDQVTTGVTGLDLGPNVRDEAWIEPWGNDAPTLANYVNRKTLLTITMWVKSTSVSALTTKLNSIRDEFVNIPNRVRYSIGGPLYDITTYPSPIDPIDLSNNSMPLLHAAAHQFLVPSWTFSVWRRPAFDGQTKPPVV